MWATMTSPITSSALLPPYILAMATAEQDMKLKMACISRGGGHNQCAAGSCTGTASIARLPVGLCPARRTCRRAATDKHLLQPPPKARLPHTARWMT